jgi:hypothetical protein
VNGIAMLFGIWQRRYAAHRIATFPVRISDEGKVPAIRGWQRIGLSGSTKLVQTMVDADALGFCPGKRSGLTILDIDSSDERILAEALDRHGPTPILVRSGSGNYQGWYRHNGETRRIRPDPNRPIDILGSGFVVAPPSRGVKSNYEFIDGGLNDLVVLPCLRNVPPPTSHQTQSSRRVPICDIAQGTRNNSLWEHCMREAHHCDDFDALLDVARTSNTSFVPPLPDDEVMKIAKSAWDYTRRGENRFGRHGVYFSTEKVNQLIARDPDQFVLLAFLRANNGPNSNFMVANGLAQKLGWGRKRFAAKRRDLERTHIKMVTRPSAHNGPARYRWRAKGGPN